MHSRVFTYKEALDSLPDPSREVVVLCALCGHSYEAASEILQIPSLNVRRILNNARLQMARRIRRRTRRH